MVDLSAEEIDDAKLVLVGLAHQESLPDYPRVQTGNTVPAHGRLRDINPVIDEQGVM